MFGRLVVALILSIPFTQHALCGEWKRDGFATQRFSISGTGGRNNPLRRSLDPPFSGDELFVRMRLRYDAKSIDTPDDGNGEFFVLWMDEVEGAAGSSHANHVPNIGLHVQGDENRFMVRFQSSNQHFGPVLEGDREYLIVGRLWKSQAGESMPFDQLDLWVDPQNKDEFSPAASASSKESIATVRWIGFSTGIKTEIDDLIDVWDIEVAKTWREIMGLPAKSATESLPPAPRPKTVSFREHVYPITVRQCQRYFQLLAPSHVDQCLAASVAAEQRFHAAGRETLGRAGWRCPHGDDHRGPPRSDRRRGRAIDSAGQRLWTGKRLPRDFELQRIPLHPMKHPRTTINRRTFSLASALGVGQMALHSLFADDAARGNAAARNTAPPHHEPTSNSVILLFMAGGPSQVDTFDPKMELKKLEGQDVPQSLAKDVPKIKRAGLKNLLPSPWEFKARLSIRQRPRMLTRPTHGRARGAVHSDSRRRLGRSCQYQKQS